MGAAPPSGLPDDPRAAQDAEIARCLEADDLDMGKLGFQVSCDDADVPADALLKAIQYGDEARAMALASGPHAVRLLQQRHSPSRVTPLMRAITLRRSEALIEQLLSHGPVAAGVVLRSKEGRTAADYAQQHERSRHLAPRLRQLEAEAMKEVAQDAGEPGAGPPSGQACDAQAPPPPHTVGRCAVCSEPLKRRPKLLMLEDRYFKGLESNRLVGGFFERHNDVFLKLMQPNLHVLHDKKRMNKELSESLAIVEALERAAGGAGDADSLSRWHVIDLCSGRSLTAGLLALQHPGLTVTTVDRVLEADQPHFAEAGLPVVYRQLDVMADTFPQEMADTVAAAGGRPVALLGMHLCGLLSFRAIEVFAAIQGIGVCILSPCCVPPAGEAPEAMQPLYGSKNTMETQFAAWEGHLEAHLRHSCPEATVRSEVVLDIISPRRTVITAVKPPHCVGSAAS